MPCRHQTRAPGAQAKVWQDIFNQSTVAVPQQQHNTAKMLPSISTNHSENSAHSPGTSPVASPASDAGTSASSCTITACDKGQISVPVRAPQEQAICQNQKVKGPHIPAAVFEKAVAQEVDPEK
ncbi:hypothetical protein OOU_Y34scaffold01153g1 [Pyricularia oryzae Y34]|uniref:Uncharacterized protein n=1 Tax=Pyricularia oryzae (strain Y34) TaxID=1143189 RepID=A0AA97PFB3_PYRO3|nr:hypothetical protein OOU_Y34scaffold01153g1 [Pyricularia oryzae Y34]